MKIAYTTDSVTAAERLTAAVADVSPDKAALAAMITESFISGMTAQERLMPQNNAPADGEK